MSPVRQFDLNSVDLSPVKFNHQASYQSPMKKTKNRETNGKIISPERGNPFVMASPVSRDHKRQLFQDENCEELSTSAYKFNMQSVKHDRSISAKATTAAVSNGTSFAATAQRGQINLIRI